MEVRRLRSIAAFVSLARLAPFAGSLAAGASIGCGSDAVGTDVCQQIEEARCRQGPACGIDLQPPYFTSGTGVDACIRFYDDACRHGLVAGDPGSARVAACVAAIQNDSPKTKCLVVKTPESDPACSWLVPNPVVTDAAADAPDAAPPQDATAD